MARHRRPVALSLSGCYGPTPQASGALSKQLLWPDIAGQWRSLSGCYGPTPQANVARSKWLLWLWPTPQAGRWREALAIFGSMPTEGAEYNAVACSAVRRVCEKAGQWEEAEAIARLMPEVEEGEKEKRRQNPRVVTVVSEQGRVEAGSAAIKPGFRGVVEATPPRVGACFVSKSKGAARDAPSARDSGKK